MMTMWHIRVAPPAAASDTNPVDVADAVRAEVDAIRIALQDQASGRVRVERLVSAHRHPMSWAGSDGENLLHTGGEDWSIAVEANRESAAVVEEYLRLATERLESALGDDAYVELSRTVDHHTTYVGEMTGGYRLVVGLPHDRPLAELPAVMDFVTSAAEWLAGAIEIRELGTVRVEWSTLSLGASTGLAPDSSSRATGPVRVAQIVVDRNSTAMEQDDGPYEGMVEALCQHVACAPIEVPWVTKVQRFVVEAPAPNDDFNFWNGYQGQAESKA